MNDIWSIGNLAFSFSTFAGQLTRPRGQNALGSYSTIPYLSRNTLSFRSFQKVLQLYSNTKAAKAQLAICQQPILKQLAGEKQLYANMFERLAEEESKTKAAVAAGDQPADTEMKEEQKNDMAGGRPQVEAKHSLTPALLQRLPASPAPYLTPPC
ncbi:hypothetical protein J1605_013324 [Eschrichtius robustus]|uniref:Uncharacterized protein n=1 Tax=Eschrichtius robustus TaxID=9764 RepID=A0AB34GH85_ESCRO|nr:hypothetical protein J1605_013324 [Eschrichtius robustus]